MLKKILRWMLLCVPLAVFATRSCGQSTVTITKQVAAGTDDVEEYVGNSGSSHAAGSMYLNSSDLELMTDGVDQQKIGVRFNGITVPQGAVIEHAYIQFTTKGDKNAVAGTVIINGENADNALTFTTATNNLSARSTTMDSVSWAGSVSATWGTSAGGTQGPDQLTPDLKTIVQSIVNRSGWASGNSLVFLLTGLGVRNAYAYDGNATLAPQLILQYTSAAPPPTVIGAFPIIKYSQWLYNDGGTDLNTAGLWTASGYNDASWSSGPGKLGYSDNAVTVLGYGPNAASKYITYYFRKKFSVASVSALSDSLEVNLLRDDGAVVYINGVEVVRSNMPAGTIGYQTPSGTTVDGVDETTYFTHRIHKSFLADGINTIAVEVHQRDGTSSDLGFDLELKVAPITPSAMLIRGPYLQVATTNGIHIRWRTDQPTSSAVSYGPAQATLTSLSSDPALVMEHEIVLTGLAAHTRYWYRIGSISEPLQGDSTNFFMTLRPAGDTAFQRIGVFGDCGNNSTNQLNVRDQVAGYLGANYMDAWILLGDNAYSTGLDAEYQAEFFNIYKNGFLKQSPLFPAPGNHDYGNNPGGASVLNHKLAPYYQNFSMPTQGESGGLPSGSQAYYSFNVGNVHFLSLDSYGKEDSATLLYDTTGAQVQWIKADLAANTNKGWVVAYWHHPPYTMGSHNSDIEGDLVNVRQNLIRILERMGVDLILCGHSHDYERSRLMQGHYGLSSTFNAPVHNITQSSGLYDGSLNSCPYTKDSVTQTTGTVYAVAGSAGQLGGAQSTYPHPALAAYSDAVHGGGMLLEVQGNRLDAKWICADGAIRDRFSMMKNVSFRRSYTVFAGDSLSLTAGFNGDYSWSTGHTARTIRVAPSDTTLYVVRDNHSCVADSFQVNVLQSIPLPVKLTYFGATARNNCTNLIQWRSKGGHAGDRFTVEHSTDAVSFQRVCEMERIKSPGRSDYSFVHRKSGAGANYYRLRLSDAAGHATYSATATTHGNCTVVPVVILPNPVGDVLLVSGLPGDYSSVVVYNQSGQKVCQQSGNGVTVSADVSGLAAGIYTVQVMDAGGRAIATQQIHKK